MERIVLHMKKNAFLTFCCACVPGCGQMYQGYMRRGMSLMLMAVASVTVAAFSRENVLLILLPVVFAYSFFDTFNIRAMPPEQRAAFEDRALPVALWRNDVPGEAGRRMAVIAGWACIAFGALVLFNTVYNGLMDYAYIHAPWLADIVYYLPVLVIGAGAILLGVLLLLRRGAPARTGEGGQADE